MINIFLKYFFNIFQIPIQQFSNIFSTFFKYLFNIFFSNAWLTFLYAWSTFFLNMFQHFSNTHSKDKWVHAPVGLEEANWAPIGQQWADWGLSASSRPTGSNRPIVGWLGIIFEKYNYGVIFLKFNKKYVLFQKKLAEDGVLKVKRK